MIRSPIALRINPDPSRSPRDLIRAAATWGARGVVLEAAGDLNPDRLSETGRRELRHLLRSTELSLVALYLPTRRPFDQIDQLDDRLARIDRVFSLAYDLGTRLALTRIGPIPTKEEADRTAALHHALTELARRAEHRGVRLAIETASEPPEALATLLDQLAAPTLAASLDPAPLLANGLDPALAVRALGPHLAHVYATEPSPRTAGRPSLTFTPRTRSLDWEAYLGSLEEIAYPGAVTIWPDPAADQAATFQAIKAELDRF